MQDGLIHSTAEILFADVSAIAVDVFVLFEALEVGFHVFFAFAFALALSVSRYKTQYNITTFVV